MEISHSSEAPRASVQAFERAVRSGLAEWVGAFFNDAARDLESASLRQATAADRQHAADLLALLRGRGSALATAMVEALNEQMDPAGQPALARAAEKAPAISAVPVLSLIDEDQIDEDIAIAGIVQTIESEAEWELRQLVSFCNGLQHRQTFTVDANPLSPALCARALRDSLAPFALATPARAMLLRRVGPTMGRRLRAVYAAQVQLLESWRVKPAEFQIRKSVAMPSSAQAEPEFDRTAEARVSLARLVARAQALIDAAAPADRSAPTTDAAPFDLRLLAEPGELGQAATVPARPMDVGTAVRVMEQLFEQLAHQPSLSAGTRELVQRLKAPAREVAASEADLWADPNHPWWRLLDRVIAMGEVHEATEASQPGTATASLSLVIERLHTQAGAIDREACEQAAQQAEHVASRLHEDRQEQVVTGLGALQSVADREALEVELRNQLVRQLRLSPVPPGLRQFLLGPWAVAMAHVASRRGVKSPELDELAQCVDDLVDACGESGQAVSSARQSLLLRRARQGMAQAGLAATRIESELEDLAALLRTPQPCVEEIWEEAQDTLPLAEVLSDFGSGALPTVPIDMSDVAEMPATDEPTRAALDRQAWIASLEPGVYCRMFMMGTWMTTQLSWVSANRTLFVFSSRHGGRTHSMTRRVVEKLRSAGLAATVGQGLLLARAMDSVLDAG